MCPAGCMQRFGLWRTQLPGAFSLSEPLHVWRLLLPGRRWGFYRRVCIVNSAGAVLLDRMVAQVDRVTDFRTRFSGIRPRDLVHAAPLLQVRERPLSRSALREHTPQVALFQMLGRSARAAGRHARPARRPKLPSIQWRVMPLHR